jgi:hypothetical protein
MRRTGALLLTLFAFGCPEDPTAPKPMSELKPVSGPPPVPPAPRPVEQAPPPTVDEPKYAADDAPVTFTLGRHHRAVLDQVTHIPKDVKSFEVSHWPVIKYSTGEDLAKGKAPALFDWPVMLIEETKGGLSVRQANKKEQWSGNRGWLVLLTDAPRTSGIEKLPMAFPGGSSKSKKSTTVEVGTLGVDGTSSFRVRTLDPKKTWKLTVTSKAQGGEVVVPIVVLLADLGPGVKAASLNGKPVVKHTAVLAPGSYTLSGAAGLWMTVPAVDGMKIAELEVELAQN